MRATSNSGKKMRLLYLTHTIAWKGGGIFFTAFHQAQHLVKRGHQVTLACISPNCRIKIKKYEIEGVRIIEFPDLLWRKYRSGWDLWDALLRTIVFSGKRYDIIHGFESRPVVSLPGLFLSRMSGRPFVLTWADWFGKGGKGKGRGRILSRLTYPVETFFEDHVYPRADYCIAMGEPLAERARSLGIPREKIGVLLHGSDTEEFRMIPKDEARSRIKGLSPDIVALGYLGVLRPENAELLFQSFSRILSGLSRPCRLLLIGNTKLNWRAYAPPECRPHILETGWLSYREINHYLSACDLLVLPLKKELWTDNVWPSKLNDYLSAGRPIVSTRLRVLEKIFLIHKIGELCSASPLEFADCCLGLLASPQLQENMSRNARKLAEGELSWNAIVEKLEHDYLRILRASA